MIGVDSRGIEAAFQRTNLRTNSRNCRCTGLRVLCGRWLRSRYFFLQRPSKDIDVVVVGSGIAMAEALGKRLGRGAHVSVFKNFGTAQVKYKGTEVEFVGDSQGVISSGFTKTYRGRRNTGR